MADTWPKRKREKAKREIVKKRKGEKEKMRRSQKEKK